MLKIRMIMTKWIKILINFSNIKNSIRNSVKSIGNSTKSIGMLANVTSKIVYYNPGTFSCNETFVLREVKSSCKNKSWFNIKDLEDQSHQNVDFANITYWKKC